MKILKWIAAMLGGLFLLYACWIGVALFRLPPVAALADSRSNMTIRVKDWHGAEHDLVVGPQNPWWTPSEKIPDKLIWAVIVAEDANFYRHEGVDVKALKSAIRYDLANRRFARGASTITQQTAKNLFLSRQKTLTRKVEELYLAKRMEQTLSKERILELYLNVAELGPMVYGVGHASRYYFDKRPASLTFRESAFLAAMLPGPQKVYNPYRHLDRVLKRSALVLRGMRSRGVLTEAQYREALAETPDISGMQRKVDRSFSGQVRKFFQGVFRLFQ